MYWLLTLGMGPDTFTIHSHSKGGHILARVLIHYLVKLAVHMAGTVD